MINLDRIRRQGLPPGGLQVLRYRLAGRTRRETGEALGLSGRRYRRLYQHVAAILRARLGVEALAVLEQEVYTAERARVPERAVHLHLMHHDVEEETPAGARWRSGAFGQPQGEVPVDNAGNPVVLRAVPWGGRAEDVLGQ